MSGLLAIGSLALASFAGPKPGFAARKSDWRIGPVVYQVFLDRFAPPGNPESKRAIFRPPRLLMHWDDLPKPGTLIPGLGLYSHELAFWGGDFQGLRNHLDYIANLGADVVYLNPIHLAFTNHKYDAEDFGKIDPQFGTPEEFHGVVDAVHHAKMKLILDGVFNHMGRQSPIFKDAQSSPRSTYRDWFYFDSAYRNGYRAFAGAGNLPALKLENETVQQYLWAGPNSVVRKYLREGVDGWRLDVAFELGPAILSSITEAAHREKPGSAVVGEISGYPSGWFPAVDGVFNFYSLSLVESMLRGAFTGAQAGNALNHLVLDAGIDHLLRSWLLTDNHDTDRLASQLPDLEDRKMIWAMQMCLPGSPVIYYGTELGMKGAGDPQNRAPMRWDIVTETNQNLSWVQKLIRIRRANAALRYGDFLAMDSNRLLAFVRTTDKLLETRLVVANPTQETVEESFPVRVGRLMSWGGMKDVLTGEQVRVVNGILKLRMPAKSVRIYSAEPMDEAGYSPYHRIP